VNPNRNRKRGKATERQVAKMLNGRRMGILGKHDVEAGDWAVEVKDRVACVLFKWMEQAVRNCPPGKTPVVIAHKTGSSHGEDLICIQYRSMFEGREK
jgi:hypothetical protein